MIEINKTIPFPDKKYQIIYADPPWRFEKGFWDRSKSNPTSHYDTMSIPDICALPIGTISADNSHLYMWTTSRHLMDGDAVKVIKSWGFTPMNIITWCKPQISLGYYFRNSTEHLLFAKKGKLHTLDRVQGTYKVSDRLKHSQKPQYFRDTIVRCSGNLSRIELFARQRTPGWDVWGNEVDKHTEQAEMF